jgi:2-keto-3-deoxy-L-rhamnonate aldolase RhmA
MKLAYITKDPSRAMFAENSGVDRIFLDLERLGKAGRQAGQGLFLSNHQLEDIAPIRKVISRAQLMVRVDPIHPGSKQQITSVIDAGADLVMLPYFHRLDEAQTFLDVVGGRAETVLLVETRQAAAILDDLLLLPGLCEIHLGLNDLSLSLKKKFLFDLLVDGTIEGLCESLRRSGLPYGIGGLAALHRSDLSVPPELMLAYQVCLGATRGWLGRTFRDVPSSMLAESIAALHRSIKFWNHADLATKQNMHVKLRRYIAAARA